MKDVASIRRANLALLVQQAGGQAPLAARLGKDRNQVWQWLRPDGHKHGRSLSSEIAREVERVFALPPGWMDQAHKTYVEGTSTDSQRTEVSEPGPAAKYGSSQAPPGDFVEIPVFGAGAQHEGGADEVDVMLHPDVAAAAGAGADNSHAQGRTIPLRFRAESLRRKGIQPQQSAVIYARGDSMEPLISSGDAILFDRSRSEVVDGQLYVIQVDGQEMVKRLHRRPGGRVLVQSENPAHPAFEVALDQQGFTVLGRVMWRSGWL